MNDLAIETIGLTRNFGQLRALDSLTVGVPRGTIFGFLGPNGAGKTTTIRLLLGLLEATSGQARVLGFDVKEQAEKVRERVGVLLESDGLYSRLPAWDNLDFFGQVYRLPKGERQARAEELLRHLGLWERRADRVADYSKGMRQKLAVARAMLHRPQLIFLDEPTSGMDALSAVALREDIRNLARREGATVFLTTHNLAEAEKVCDLVGIIRHGTLVAIGSIDELRQQAVRPRLQLVGRGLTPTVRNALRAQPSVLDVGETDTGLMIDLEEGASAAPLVTFLVNRGVEVEEVKRVGASLEEAFLALVRETES